MTLSWVDSHCHLQERYVADDVEEAAIDALRRARDAGVSGVVCVGTDEVTSRQAVALSLDVGGRDHGASLPEVRAVIGLHPHEAGQSRGWIQPMIDEFAGGIAGIGECGLDYFYEHASKEEQREAFCDQIGLAFANELPLVIHARDAWEDLFSIFESEGVPPETVLHCFTGEPQHAQRCVELGMSVSFSGIVTFKNATALREAVKEVPLSRLLIETDSPFLTPVPHRGQSNEPAYAPLVSQAVAESAGLSVLEIAAATSTTAERIFGLGSPLPGK